MLKGKGWFFLGGGLLWTFGFWWGVRSVPVGLCFQPGQKGLVSAVAVYHDGHETELPRKAVGEDGIVTFGVDRAARTFYFRL